jgi:alkylation response protein AidB-like acyl-CoA dehydrogenase
LKNSIVDERDLSFVINEQLKCEELIGFERYADHSKEIFDMVIENAVKFAWNEIFPTLVEGDKEGATFDGKTVKVPDCYRKPIETFCENGWMTLAEDYELGGQQLPNLIACATGEIFAAANFSFLGYPALGHGTGKMIELFGTDEQKALYLEKLYTAEWLGTMCLTESSAGSDLAAVRTVAEPIGDGKFKLTGTKIFITCGDSDLRDNIIHPVLAKIKGTTAKGTKAISIFIVPKNKINEDGSVGEWNDVTTVGIEHKLGITGSATCSLNFGDNEDCIGELLGKEGEGLKIMFVMMNEARLNVGLQSLGNASTAYLHAVAYARQRIQGGDPKDLRNPEAERVAIIKHPDVRRMLLQCKSYIDGLRSLNYYTAWCIDQAHASPDEANRKKYSGFLDLLTPICKAYGSDIGFRITEWAMQIYGGYGYTKEYPIELLMRDSKIASIYEGANGIQALDFFGRKLPAKGGSVMMAMIGEINGVLADASAIEELKPYAEKVSAAVGKFGEVAMKLGPIAMQDFVKVAAHITPILEVFGDICMGWQLAWQATIAHKKLQEIYTEKGVCDDEEGCAKLAGDNTEVGFYVGKIASFRFVAGTLMPVTLGKLASIDGLEQAANDIPDTGFCSMID